MKRLNTILLLFFILIMCASNSYALNEETHSLLNTRIAQMGFLDDYLADNLNMGTGVKSVFNGKNVQTWINDGGTFEDSRPVPTIYPRSYYHFHDPTKPLADAGFSGDIVGIPIHNGDWKSSIEWALSENLQSTSTLGCYSWPCVREYFYQALTATDKNARENNFADTFRALGQVMHLVEDASVPAHTRDDGHVSHSYETPGAARLSCSHTI